MQRMNDKELRRGKREKHKIENKQEKVTQYILNKSDNKQDKIAS